MKRNFIVYALTAVSFFLYEQPIFSQARLILNGAGINLSNGARLVIANPAGNAITRNSGAIITVGQNNYVQWMIGTTADNYMVPWGFGAAGYLPLSFSTSSAVGNGNFLLSTYGTGWQNSLSLPPGVTNVNRNGVDNSAHVIDRFWQISAQGYTSKPILTNLSFGYLDIEYSEPNNTIAETALAAQRWNDIAGTWSDFPPSGTDDPVNNLVTVPLVNSSDLYSWWTLVDMNFPLPLNFLSFEAHKQGSQARLTWTTTNEINVKNFDIQRCQNGIDFITIGSEIATGSINFNSYFFLDSLNLTGRVYYRIRENDQDAHYQYSEIRSLTFSNDDFWQIYPNPVSGQQININSSNAAAGIYQVSLTDSQGQLISTRSIFFNKNTIVFPLNSYTAKGFYVLKISNETMSVSSTLLIE